MMASPENLKALRGKEVVGNAESGIFKKMVRAYEASKGHMRGKTYVVYAPKFTGKSVAAADLLSKVREAAIPNGLIVLAMGSRNIPYQNVVADSVGVPKFYQDRVAWYWLRPLLKSLADPLSSRPWYSFERCSSLLGCANAATLAEAGIVKNEIGECPPVLILDDVYLRENFEVEDVGFFNTVAKMASDLRILVFLLTNDKDTATKFVTTDLCIEPCPGFYKEKHGLKEWREYSWSEEKLTELLEKGSRGDDIKKTCAHEWRNNNSHNPVRVLKCVKGGMTLDEALDAVGEEMQGLPNSTRKKISVTRAKK